MQIKLSDFVTLSSSDDINIPPKFPNWRFKTYVKRFYPWMIG